MILQPTLQDVIKYADEKATKYRDLVSRRFFSAQDDVLSYECGNVSLPDQLHQVGRFFSTQDDVTWKLDFTHGNDTYIEIAFDAYNLGSRILYSDLKLRFNFNKDSQVRNYKIELERELEDIPVSGSLCRLGSHEALKVEVRTLIEERTFTTAHGKIRASSDMSVPEAYSLLQFFFEDILEGKK